MSEKRSALMLYLDFLEAFMELSDRDLGRLFRAMIKYAATGEEPDFNGKRDIEILWLFIRPRIDADGKRYEKAVLQKKYAVYVREQKRRCLAYMSFEEYENCIGGDRPMSGMYRSAYFDNP